VDISLVLAIFLLDCLTLKLSTQLHNTNLGFLILFRLWCKKVTLAIKEKTLKQNMVRSKCLKNFWSQIFKNVTGCPMYEDFWSILCHSLLYFAMVTYIN